MDKIQKQFKKEQNKILCEISQLIYDAKIEWLEQKGWDSQYSLDKAHKEIQNALNNKAIKERYDYCLFYFKKRCTEGACDCFMYCDNRGTNRIRFQIRKKDEVFINIGVTKFFKSGKIKVEYEFCGLEGFAWIKEDFLSDKLADIKQRFGDNFKNYLEKIKKLKLTLLLQNQSKMKYNSCMNVMETFQKIIRMQLSDEQIIRKIHQIIFIDTKRDLFQRKEKLDGVIEELCKLKIRYFEFEKNVDNTDEAGYDYKTDNFSIDFIDGDGKPSRQILICFEGRNSLTYNINGFCGSQFFQNSVIEQFVNIWKAFQEQIGY